MEANNTTEATAGHSEQQWLRHVWADQSQQTGYSEGGALKLKQSV